MNAIHRELCIETVSCVLCVVYCLMANMVTLIPIEASMFGSGPTHCLPAFVLKHTVRQYTGARNVLSETQHAGSERVERFESLHNSLESQRSTIV